MVFDILPAITPGEIRPLSEKAASASHEAAIELARGLADMLEDPDSELFLGEMTRHANASAGLVLATPDHMAEGGFREDVLKAPVTAPPPPPAPAAYDEGLARTKVYMGGGIIIFAVAVLLWGFHGRNHKVMRPISYGGVPLQYAGGYGGGRYQFHQVDVYSTTASDAESMQRLTAAQPPEEAVYF